MRCRWSEFSTSNLTVPGDWSKCIVLMHDLHVHVGCWMIFQWVAGNQSTLVLHYLAVLFHSSFRSLFPSRFYHCHDTNTFTAAYMYLYMWQQLHTVATVCSCLKYNVKLIVTTVFVYNLLAHVMSDIKFKHKIKRVQKCCKTCANACLKEILTSK